MAPSGDETMDFDRERVVRVLCASVALAAAGSAAAQSADGARAARSPAATEHSQADLERRLADARDRLEQAAREVATLSQQLAGEDVRRLRTRETARGARVDVQRDGATRSMILVTRGRDPGLVRLHYAEDLGVAIPDLDAPLRLAFEGFHPWSGLELATLTEDLGRYFGAERGVLVVSAPADGRLPLRDGDVIASIDGREPRSGAHALRILRSYRPGDGLTLSVLRDHRAQQLDVTMPTAPATPGPGGVPPAPPTPRVPPTPPSPGSR